MSMMAENRLNKAIEKLEGYKNGINDKSIGEVLKLVAEALEAQAGTLWFYYRFEDGLIRPITVYGGEALTNIYLLPGEGIAGQVIDKGEPIVISDCKTDTRWTKKVDVETGFETQSTICVPLEADGLTYGSIQLVNKAENGFFDEQDLLMLEKIAQKASPILSEYCERRTGNFCAKKDNSKLSVINRISTYMDPSIIHEILRDDGKHKKSIEPKDAAVLFADIRGFTGLAQKISASQLISALSDFLSVTSHRIHAYGGIIDKFMGDCVMAYWRCEDDPAATESACRCAMEIQEAAKEFTQRLLRQTGVEVGIGIGIHVGPVLLCHVGDEEYMAYTVIGSSVNTACRIEEHTPAGKVYISGEVAKILGSAAIIGETEKKPSWKGKGSALVVLELKEI